MESISYLENDFENVALSLSKSTFSNLLSDVIISILKNSSDDASFTFMNKCIQQINKKHFDQAPSLSNLILRYILISERNKEMAIQSNWAQELIWYLYSVYDFQRSNEFLENLDFSNLFNVLSVLISRAHRPNDIYGLIRIKDQVLLSSKHCHSFIAFLIKLDNSNVLRSDVGNHAFSTAITDFEISLESGRVPNISSSITLIMYIPFFC